MSVYEALSLLVSAVGTLGTVYIGLRQLRQSASVPSPAPGPVPSPAPAGSSPPGSAPPGFPPGAPGFPPAQAPRRPGPVTAASLVLFVVASAHPVGMATYYTVRTLTAPETAAAELRSGGVVDLLVFGGVAFLTALLGVFVLRRARAALRTVWVIGAASLVLSCAMAALGALATLAPEADRPSGFDLLFLGYFAFVLLGYAAAALLLAAAPARAYFRRA